MGAVLIIHLGGVSGGQETHSGEEGSHVKSLAAKSRFVKVVPSFVQPFRCINLPLNTLVNILLSFAIRNKHG